MSVFVITWNLNKERSNYNQARTVFLAHLEQYDNTADSELETVRWIATTSSANQIDEFLRQKLDGNDRLFVSQVTRGNNSGWLQKSTWDWINARL